MTWMLTTTGNAVDLRFLDVAPVDILDIAHSLALQCRFTGHSLRQYSVAEHSLLVVEIMERELGIHAPEALLAGLMHDAHEAYTGDLSSPMKAIVGEAWLRAEREAMYGTLEAFDLVDTFMVWRAEIKRADLIALSTERRDLMHPGGPAWPCTEEHPPVGWIDLNDRASLDWTDWRRAFLDRYAALRMACGYSDDEGA